MITNAKEFPQIYYGLHMTEGVAEYKNTDGTFHRILVNEQAIRDMGPSFVGKPVYVNHVDEVSPNDIGQGKEDGYVIESFFNQADGKHWVKFMIVSDRGHEAIRQKHWKLSNAYHVKDSRGSGTWHAVQYDREVTRGEYQHLAIVPNPRYEESIILTPEEFKAYNSRKEQELKALKNSKGDRPMKFQFWKKSKVENAADIADASVTLSNGKEMTVEQLVNAAEEQIREELSKKNEDEKQKENEAGEPVKVEHVMANGDHLVEVGGEKMSVNSLVEKYNSMISAETERKNSESAAAAAKVEEEKKNSEEKKEEEQKKNASHFDALKNASDRKEATVIETSIEQSARGKARYGSGS